MWEADLSRWREALAGMSLGDCLEFSGPVPAVPDEPLVICLVGGYDGRRDYEGYWCGRRIMFAHESGMFVGPPPAPVVHGKPARHVMAQVSSMLGVDLAILRGGELVAGRISIDLVPGHSHSEIPGVRYHRWLGGDASSFGLVEISLFRDMDPINLVGVCRMQGSEIIRELLVVEDHGGLGRKGRFTYGRYLGRVLHVLWDCGDGSWRTPPGNGEDVLREYESRASRVGYFQAMEDMLGIGLKDAFQLDNCVGVG